jgi:hypothetical protein
MVNLGRILPEIAPYVNLFLHRSLFSEAVNFLKTKWEHEKEFFSSLASYFSNSNFRAAADRAPSPRPLDSLLPVNGVVTRHIKQALTSHQPGVSKQGLTFMGGDHANWHNQ